MLNVLLAILKPLNDFFFDEFAPHEDQYSGQNYAFTGSVAINPD